MSWWKTAKVGDEVVCVDMPIHSSSLFSGVSLGAPQSSLTIGSTYIIGGFIDSHTTERNPAGVSIHINGHWCGVNLFKPVEKNKTKTGMEVLKSILNGSPVHPKSPEKVAN